MNLADCLSDGIAKFRAGQTDSVEPVKTMLVRFMVTLTTQVPYAILDVGAGRELTVSVPTGHRRNGAIIWSPIVSLSRCKLPLQVVSSGSFEARTLADLEAELCQVAKDPRIGCVLDSSLEWFVSTGATVAQSLLKSHERTLRIRHDEANVTQPKPKKRVRRKRK